MLGGDERESLHKGPDIAAREMAWLHLHSRETWQDNDPTRGPTHAEQTDLVVGPSRSTMPYDEGKEGAKGAWYRISDKGRRRSRGIGRSVCLEACEIEEEAMFEKFPREASTGCSASLRAQKYLHNYGLTGIITWPSKLLTSATPTCNKPLCPLMPQRNCPYVIEKQEIGGGPGGCFPK